MAPIERDACRDSTHPHLKHSHSGSIVHGALIPMWDSSDPERAPPPLPLNPQSPLTSRVGTSSAIASAHAALNEKARESTNFSQSTSRRPPDLTGSPVRGSAAGHKRMQSFQPSAVRDLGLYLENGPISGSSTPRSLSPEKGRPSTPGPIRENARDRETPQPHERGHSQPPSLSTTPVPGPSDSLTPILRPIARRHQTSILGENTPPQSDTMKALQTMATPAKKEKHPNHFHHQIQPQSAGPASHVEKLEREAQMDRESTPLSNVTNQANNNAAFIRGPPPPPPHQQKVHTHPHPDPQMHLPYPTSIGEIPDALSVQIQSLTNIAQALQKEMSNLTRRSRDNATDLMSLKDATNQRDEDIRKTLRDLLHTVQDSSRPATRDPYGGPLLVDGAKAFGPQSPSKTPRPFSLPRIPSPNSFGSIIDRESMISTPSLVNDGPGPSTALLERVLQEMGTKEGQNNLVSQLDKLASMVKGMPSQAKIEELIDFIKANTDTQQRAVMAAATAAAQATAAATSASRSGGNDNGGGNIPRNRPASPDDDPLPRGRELHLPALTQNERTSSAPPARGPGGADLPLNDDFLKIIRTVKDSVAQGGGMTAEVKALVRELRGEVLGMGRELGRRLDEVSAKSVEKDEVASKDEIEVVVEEGLTQVKKNMGDMMKEHRVDYHEVYQSLRKAITDAEESRPAKEELKREHVVEAIKDAWEEYKPEITVEQIGLERDEILECLREGIAQSMPADDDKPRAATQDDVMTAVEQGLKAFEPPKIDFPATLTRNEVLEVVRECLEDFDFPEPEQPETISKQDVLEAVKEGLEGFDFPTPATNSRALIPHGTDLDAASDAPEDEVVERLKEILTVMNAEFKMVSEEAKKNVADNGRDAEQALAATKDGFAQLRADMEIYVDRAAGLAGQDDFMDGLVNTLDTFRDEVSELVEQSSSGSKDMLRGEIESLREAVNSSLVPHNPQVNHDDVVSAVHEGLAGLREALENIRTEVIRPKPAPTDLLDALQEGFGDLRASIEKMGDKPPDLTANDEILDALKEGLDHVRSDIDAVREQTQNANDKAVTPFMGGDPDATASDPSMAIIPANFVKSEDIRNLEDIIAELGKKIESMDRGPQPRQPSMDRPVSSTDRSMPAPTVPLPSDDGSNYDEDVKEDISISGDSEDALKNAPAASHPTGTRGVTKDQVDRLEELLKRPDEDYVRKEDLARLEDIIRDVKEAVTEASDKAAEKAGKTAASAAIASLPTIGMRSRAIPKQDAEAKDSSSDSGSADSVLEGNATREDIQAIETILRNTKARIDDLVDSEQAVRKDHIDALEALVLDTKQTMSTLQKQDLDPLEALMLETKESLEATANKQDLEEMGKLVGETKEQVQGVTTQLADIARREDVSMLEAMVAQVHAAFEEMREREEMQLADPEKVTKVMVKDVETHCLEIQKTISNIKETDLPTLSTKADVMPLVDLTEDLKDKVSKLSEEQAKAFEERQAEIVGVSDRVTEVKTFLSEFQDLVKEKLEEGATGMDALAKVLEDMSESLSTNSTTFSTDLKSMFETMKTEFEDSRSSFIGAKLETDEKLQETVEGLTAKFDEKITEVLTRYEEFAIVLDDREKKGDERDVKVEESVQGTKALADDLRVLVDTLGSTVTDSLEKMEEASKTVFGRVEELVKKTDDREDANRSAHEQTRDDINEAVRKVETLQESVSKSQPQILQNVKDLLLLVGEHVEQSKQGAEDLKKHIEENKPSPPPPFPIDEVKYDDSDLQDKLDALVSHSATERHDIVHEKLDKLVDYHKTSDDAYARLDTLDKVHAQVVATAAEISLFLENQKQRLTDEHGDREKALQETVLSLERKSAEKDALDTNLSALRDEVARLKEEEQAVRDGMTIARDLKDEEDKLRNDILNQLRAEVERLKEEEEQMREAITAGAQVREDEDSLRRDMLSQVRAEVEHLKQEESKMRESIQNAVDLKAEEDAIRSSVLDALREEESCVRESLAKQAKLREEEDMLRYQMLASLKEEEEELRAGVARLRGENEEMGRVKARLTKDVGSLETALHLRREDLDTMERRAEGLEKRILEGVMDHSRALLLAKGGSGGGAGKGKGERRREREKAMSRKRVSGSHTLQRLTEEDEATPGVPSTPKGSLRSKRPSARGSAISVAMNRSINGGGASPATAANKRILSLSQISQNLPSGALGRSQSVRDGKRKSSWAGRVSTASSTISGTPPPPEAPKSRVGGRSSLGASDKKALKSLGEDDKENVPAAETGAGALVLASTAVATTRGGESPRDGGRLAIEAAPTAPSESEYDDGDTQIHHDDEVSEDEYMSGSGSECYESDEEEGTLRRSSVGRSEITASAVSGDCDDYESGSEDDEEESRYEDDDMTRTESVVTGSMVSGADYEEDEEMVVRGDEVAIVGSV